MSKPPANGHAPMGSTSSRPARAYVADDSTESEAESSYHGWSDATGWGAATPRQSSSSDEVPRPAPPPVDIPSATNQNGRTVSFSSNSGTHHRRGTNATHRPSLHSLGSNISLDMLTPTSSNPMYPATVLNMDQVASPSSVSVPNFSTIPYTSPPSYSDSNGYNYARSRRKSVSTHAPPAPVRTESETSEEDPYLVNGIGHHGKGKRSRHRGGSFSYLPFHRRRRASSNIWPRWLLQSRRPVVDKYKVYALLAALVMGVWYAWSLFNRHFQLTLEAAIVPRRWVSTNVDDVQPLKGCFGPHSISPEYEQSARPSPFTQLLAPGLSMKRGMQCFDFSSTIKPIPEEEMRHITYHTYWRSDLIPFGERQTDTLNAFLATQPLTHSKLILWTNGAEIVRGNTHVRHFLEKWGNYIEVRQVDMTALTKNTELEGKLSTLDGGGLFDERAWVDGDAVRLLVLWHFGGVWMDMDQILTRDLHPLAETEFVTQWDCYDKPDFVLNGALMHFHRHSPYLCEAFHIMASSPLPRPNTFTWGSHLYTKLHRRLIASHIAPFTVLPWCFADPRNCRQDVGFPDPFRPDPEYWGGRRWDGRGEVGRSGREMLEERVGHVWTVHLHNQWMKSFPHGGWISRLLEGYKRQVRLIEEYARRGEENTDQRIVVKEILPTPSAEEFMSGWQEAPATKVDGEAATKEAPGVAVPQKHIKGGSDKKGHIKVDREMEEMIEEMMAEEEE